MHASAQWFIDAWAAVDGRAFASFRSAEIPGNPVERSGAGAFLAAPHFEPEWTTSPSTALTATRGHFQWGFYDKQDPPREIPFESLDELRELVRRVYIAGGGGGQGPAGAVPPEPRSPTVDDGAVLPEGLGGIDGEEPTGYELDKYLHEPHPIERREHIADALLRYMRNARYNQLVRFVADTLALATHHPEPVTDDVDIFREWSLSVLAWARFLSIIARDSSIAPTIIAQSQGRSRTRTVLYDRMIDNILDLLLGRHGPIPYWWYQSPYFNAERKAPLVTLPRFLPLPKKERAVLPGWATNVADVICILGSSNRRAVDLARNFNTAVIAGSGAAMVLCSLLTITDTPYLTLIHDMGGGGPYAEELLGKIAYWVGENIAGPDLERNVPAMAALEEYIEKKVGLYHATP